MMRRAERLNYMLLEAAKQVLEACNRGEIKATKPMHSVPLTMLANRVDECLRLEIKEDRDERRSNHRNT